jgi:eukaryotic-like serine/threonine-protein kinase
LTNATHRIHPSSSVTCLSCARSTRSTAAFFGALYPVYVRGLACSQLGRPKDAATEFQTILDHPGLVLNDPIAPMARLQLARAWSAAGDHATSAAVYADLLTLWQDADPDTPVVMQATAECAGLQ